MLVAVLMHVADMSAFGATIATCECKSVWGCSPEHHDARRAVSGREVPQRRRRRLEGLAGIQRRWCQVVRSKQEFDGRWKSCCMLYPCMSACKRGVDWAAIVVHDTKPQFSA